MKSKAMKKNKGMKKKHEEHIDETWLIPYADMLTLLLALFIVLFAMSQVDSSKFRELKRALESAFSGGVGIISSDSNIPEQDDNSPNPLDPDPLNEFLLEDERLQQYKKMLDEYFQEQGLEKSVTNSITEKGLQVSIQEMALFDSGKAILHPEALDVITNISVILGDMDNYVEISGHTDNLPISTSEFPSNWELSVARSLNVMKYMLTNQKLNPARFSVVGYGEYRPIRSNETEEGRAANRRVELLILRMFMKPPPTDG